MLSLIINKLNRIMKTNFKIAWLIALLAGMPLLLSAQEKDRSSLPREVLSPEKVANAKRMR